MSIKYRNDEDLVFLQYCEEEDLKVLARYLTHCKDGTIEPSSDLREHPDYKKLDGDPKQNIQSWKLIAGELQLFGGDTFVNIFRGNGVLYKEIISDVCNKLDIKFNKTDNSFEIENLLFSKLIKDAWDKMTEDERKELLKEIGVDVNLASAVGLAALQAAIKLGGFASYKISLIIANSVAKAIIGRGLTLLANQTLVRTISTFAGPIGWAITALTTLPALSGPAYRVTIPAVIQVAYMRRALSEKEHF